MDVKKDYIIEGFSKLKKIDKIRFIARTCKSPHLVEEILSHFWTVNPEIQQRIDEISENALSNFHLPFSIAPNFMVNGKMYLVPMVIEESSVVAAASSAAKFWSERGGFHSEVLSTTKVGQIHFIWNGNKEKLQAELPALTQLFFNHTESLTQNMRSRGGGIQKIELIDLTQHEPNYYQLKVSFETCNSMGANFINTCLEEIAKTFREFIFSNPRFSDNEKEIKIIMSILSNYTPECLVRTHVECNIDQLASPHGLSAHEFAWRFEKAVRIAEIDPYRATTHNKGIFNGIDAVVLATGNDFRAVEACGHVYACRDGTYRSLSHVEIKNEKFILSLSMPLALGVVGGLTTLHPLARLSLELLGDPTAKELMMIASAAGLANNFSAVRSLITTGIQKGHMKMHLLNILNHFVATEEQKQKAIEHFRENVISFNSVREFLNEFRN